MTPGGRQPSPGLILTATVAAAVLVMANVSALNVALPELSRELNASQTDVHWMVDIYSVALAALLLPAGALGDRFGRRLILLSGLVVVLASNAAVLFMDSAQPVIIARGVGGVGAAFVFPATLSTITAALPTDKRSRGVAMWTASVLVGGILGILASGILIENFWWGSPFLGIALATLVVLALCYWFVPDSSDPAEAHLDPVGAVLSFVGVGALILGIVEGPVEGWSSPLALYSLLGGIAALAVFVVWEWRNPRPLLDVRLFADRGIRAGSLAIFVQFLAAFGFFFVTVFYLAYVRGFGPLDTGLGLLPIGLGVLPAAAAAIPLTRRLGRLRVGVAGLCLATTAFVFGLTVSTESGFWTFGTVLILFGAGLGLSSPPATEAIVEAIPKAKQGVASALNDVLREFGAAIGIAGVGAAFNGGYRSAISRSDGFPIEAIEAVRETPAAAAIVAPELGDLGPGLVDHVSASVIEGWERSMWVLAVVVAIGAAGYYRWAPRGVAPRAASTLDVLEPVRRSLPVATSKQQSEGEDATAPEKVAQLEGVEGFKTTAELPTAHEGDVLADADMLKQVDVTVDARPDIEVLESKPVGPSLRVALLSGSDASADVDQLTRCIDKLNERTENITLTFVPGEAADVADVVIGVHATRADGLDRLIRAAGRRANGSGPGLLSFIRVGTHEAHTAPQALDAALVWDARHQLQAVGVPVVVLDQDDPEPVMLATMMRALPDWLQRSGRPAGSVIAPSPPEPELPPAVAESVDPVVVEPTVNAPVEPAVAVAGAPEPVAVPAVHDAAEHAARSDAVAGAAHTVNTLVPVFVAVSKEVRLLDRRSVIPADMDTWPPIVQTRVFGRAAAALTEPVGKLAQLTEELIDQVGRCQQAVQAVRGDAARADRADGSFDDLDRRISRVVEVAGRLAGASSELSERLSNLATRRVELRNVTRQLEGIAARCEFAFEMVSSWRDADADGGRGSAQPAR